MDFSDDLLKLFESDSEGLFNPPKRSTAPTADDRLAESFKEIVSFVEQNDRMPEIEADDISEAKLAKRLESIRGNADKIAALKELDSLGLLDMPEAPKSFDELFAKDEFGLFGGIGDEILKVKNVPTQLRSPIEKAKRTRANDFAKFKQGFETQQQLLSQGMLKLVRYVSVEQLHVGDYYVQGGLMLRIVDVGEKKRVYDRNKERFRVIYENGTESNMYRRSLSQRLYEDGYAVVPTDYAGEYPTLDATDIIKGYIYVLKSLSEDEKINTVKDLYKIGFSTTPVATRIKDAEKDPTYLMAPVKVVDSYILTGEYNPQKIEHFLHRIFADAALDLTIIDASGREYRPKEWYSVPLPVVEQAVNLLQNGDIVNYHYDHIEQRIKPNEK